MKKLVFLTVAVGLLVPASVPAQDVTMLVVPDSHYTLGGFGYDPPLLEGWRRVGGGPTSLNVIYAERIDEDQINSRLHVQVESFSIPDPNMVGDGVTLAELGRRQQIEARGDSAVAYSEVTRVPGDNEIYQYEIVTKAGDKNLHEIFFTTLAPDKSAYAVAMASTQEKDYASQPYWAQFYGTLASFKPIQAEEMNKGGAGDRPEPADAGKSAENAARTNEPTGSDRASRASAEEPGGDEAADPVQ